MRIRIWGTRGSIPAPSAPDFPTRRYGGDTSCVSIAIGDKLVILDAGTGVRHLGDAMVRGNIRTATMLFSHFHWDHIQGFPFFVPAYLEEYSFDLYAPAPPKGTSPAEHAVRTVLEQQQSAPFFPVPFQELKARFRFLHLPRDKPLEIKAGSSKILIHHAPVNHPGGCEGYRIEEHTPGGQSRAFVYITDNEHAADGTSPAVQRLAKGADLLLMDSQFTEDEYAGRSGYGPRKGWGHSTWKACLREAREAGARKLLLSHHDPGHDDSFITLMERGARREGAKHGVEVEAAVQFREYDIA